MSKSESSKEMVLGSKIHHPRWLTKLFLEDILKKYFGDRTIFVISFHLSPPADFKLHISAMHRVAVNYHRNGGGELLQLVFKVNTKDESSVFSSRIPLFCREISFYTNVIEEMMQLLKDCNDNKPFTPKCYYTNQNESESMIVLEDLNEKNYKMMDSGKLLDLEHALIVLEKLAKMHACSAILHEKSTETIQTYQITAKRVEYSLGEFYIPLTLLSLCEEFQNDEDLKKIVENLKDLKINILEDYVNLYSISSRGYNNSSFRLRVLNHGDFWINNFLFKYHENVVTDVMLLDFELLYFGSPAIDLNTFLYGCISEQVREKHFKSLIREYHRILQETLEMLRFKSEIPTLKELHIELIQTSLIGVITALCKTPLIFMNQSRVYDYCKYFKGIEADEIRTELFKKPECKKFLENILKELELCGFLCKN